MRKVWLLLSLLVMTTQARPLTWYLENVEFTDGARAIGSFDYDPDTQTYSNVHIITFDGSQFGATYTSISEGRPGAFHASGVSSDPMRMAVVTLHVTVFLDDFSYPFWLSSTLPRKLMPYMWEECQIGAQQCAPDARYMHHGYFTCTPNLAILRFEGNVDSVDPLLSAVGPDRFALGNRAIIQYAFDTTIPGMVNAFGASYYAIVSLTFSILRDNSPPYSAAASMGLVQVANDSTVFGPKYDHYFAGATNSPYFQLIAPPARGRTVTGVYVGLSDLSATALDSTDLPVTLDARRFKPAPPYAVEGISLRVQGPGGESDPRFVSASLTSVPTSRVAQRPSSSGVPSFLLQWSGTDPGGQGLRDYTIYVSDNGSRFTRWITTQELEATFTGVPGHSYSFFSLATDVGGNVEQAKSKPEATVTVVAGATGTGAGITVAPVDAGTGGNPVTISFDSVTRAGTTSLTSSSSGPPPPSGFTVGSPTVYYDVTTTALFTGRVTVCVNYDGTTFTSAPMLFHFENGVWVDVTTSRDLASKIVCGSISVQTPAAPAVVRTLTARAADTNLLHLFALFAPIVNTWESSSPYQVRYLSNLNVVDSFVNISNVGALSGNDPAGRICANIYVFDPNEEPVSCCACPVTPNGLVSLSARDSLVANPLTFNNPNSLVVKIVYTAMTGGACDAGQLPLPAPLPVSFPVNPADIGLVRGGVAWAVTPHGYIPSGQTNPTEYRMTETPFLNAELSPTEYVKLVSVCRFIESYASRFGICRGCTATGR